VQPNWQRLTYLTQLMSVPGGRCGVKIDKYCRFASSALVAWTIPLGQTWTSPAFTGRQTPLISNSPLPPRDDHVLVGDRVEVGAYCRPLHGCPDHHLRARALEDDLAVDPLFRQGPLQVVVPQVQKKGHIRSGVGRHPVYLSNRERAEIKRTTFSRREE